MAVFMCWGFILSIFIFLALSILVIYSDGIISILVIIGFPITNWEDVISIALLNALLIAIKFGCLLISKETISRLNRSI